jgi:uncharacterized protein (TIGR02145 family)
VKAQEGKIEGKTLKDNRDGKKYKTVIIGVQTWMAENLNYDAKDSKCYDDKPENCSKYGRLYNWETAKEVCPDAWHLPSDEEWTKLTGFIGNNAGVKLKATSGWNSSSNGTDNYGFSALPGGWRNSDGSFFQVDSNGSWWSATGYDSHNAYSRNVLYNGSVMGEYSSSKFNLCSVRCVRDSQPTQEPTLVGAIIPLLLVVGIFVAIFLVLKKFLKFFFRKIKSLRTEKKN